MLQFQDHHHQFPTPVSLVWVLTSSCHLTSSPPAAAVPNPRLSFPDCSLLNPSLLGLFPNVCHSYRYSHIHPFYVNEPPQSASLNLLSYTFYNHIPVHIITLTLSTLIFLILDLKNVISPASTLLHSLSFNIHAWTLNS